jgi:hypothetical protein
MKHIASNHASHWHGFTSSGIVRILAEIIRILVELRGNELVEYDGEVNSAANLFDALKEGYYGKY